MNYYAFSYDEWYEEDADTLVFSSKKKYTAKEFAEIYNNAREEFMNKFGGNKERRIMHNTFYIIAGLMENCSELERVKYEASIKNDNPAASCCFHEVDISKIEGIFMKTNNPRGW